MAFIKLNFKSVFFVAIFLVFFIVPNKISGYFYTKISKNEEFFLGNHVFSIKDGYYLFLDKQGDYVYLFGRLSLKYLLGKDYKGLSKFFYILKSGYGHSEKSLIVYYSEAISVDYIDDKVRFFSCERLGVARKDSVCGLSGDGKNFVAFDSNLLIVFSGISNLNDALSWRYISDGSE